MEPHGPPLQPFPVSCQVAFWLVAQVEMLAVIVIGAAPACTEFVFGFSVTPSVIGGFTVKGNPAAVLPWVRGGVVLEVMLSAAAVAMMSTVTGAASPDGGV